MGPEPPSVVLKSELPDLDHDDHFDHDDHPDHDDHINHDDHRICKEDGGCTQASLRLSDLI